jgi:hypothetical protein
MVVVGKKFIPTSTNYYYGKKLFSSKTKKLCVAFLILKSDLQ